MKRKGLSGVLGWKRKHRVKGWWLVKDQMLLVQQGSGEVVDRPNSAERHGVVPPPEQIRAKHHSQVAVGHLIRLALV